jgi:hypothetical protein
MGSNMRGKFVSQPWVHGITCALMVECISLAQCSEIDLKRTETLYIVFWSQYFINVVKLDILYSIVTLFSLYYAPLLPEMDPTIYASISGKSTFYFHTLWNWLYAPDQSHQVYQLDLLVPSMCIYPIDHAFWCSFILWKYYWANDHWAVPHSLYFCCTSRYVTPLLQLIHLLICIW